MDASNLGTPPVPATHHGDAVAPAKPHPFAADVRRALLPELMDVAALAAAINRSERTAREWCADGTIPARRVRGRWMVRRDDLLAALAPLPRVTP